MRRRQFQHAFRGLCGARAEIYSHSDRAASPGIVDRGGRRRTNRKTPNDRRRSCSSEPTFPIARPRFGSAAQRRSTAPAPSFKSWKRASIARLPTKTLTDGLEVYRELLDKDGKPVTRTQLGEPITVRLRLRSLRPEPMTNVAVIDLLPGGFEVVGSSL